MSGSITVIINQKQPIRETYSIDMFLKIMLIEEPILVFDRNLTNKQNKASSC